MKRVILVLGPSRCNIGMLGCYRVLEGVTGSHWAVTEAEEVLRVEESGEGREWRRGFRWAGLPPSVAREEAWRRWEAPTFDGGGSLAPASHRPRIDATVCSRPAS